MWNHKKRERILREWEEAKQKPEKERQQRLARIEAAKEEWRRRTTPGPPNPYPTPQSDEEAHWIGVAYRWHGEGPLRAQTWRVSCLESALFYHREDTVEEAVELPSRDRLGRWEENWLKAHQDRPAELEQEREEERKSRELFRLAHS